MPGFVGMRLGGGAGLMAECLECQRLKKENEALGLVLIKYANRWLLLKRLIIEEDINPQTRYHQKKK